jgi:Chaperone of endosialidase
MNPLTHFKQTIPPLLVTLVIGCFGLLPQMQAVSPTPDGCYPNFTTAEGCDALSLLTTGAGNTGLGWRSLFLDSTGSFNTGVGSGALALNNADSNTAVGAAALLLNTSGIQNTAVGTDALVFNDSGNNNNALGAFALFNNFDGVSNTAVGTQALFSNTTGNFNTANGFKTLFSNTNGGSNVATGYQALVTNTTGGANTAHGFEALFSNTTGDNNTAIGVGALISNTTGNNNIALGVGAGQNLTTGNGNIDIGNSGLVGEDLTIRIGGGNGTQTRTFIAGIRGVTTGNNDAIPVVIDSAGQLGTMSSSRRFKHEIKPMDDASEAIHALKPVTFQYKIDKTNTPQFGLIAEEVAQVDPDLVVRDENGEIYTVRYDAVNAMLLNEFLKEHRKVEDLKEDFRATVAQQQKETAALAATVKEQASQIQKVSAQLEASKFATGRIRRGGPAPQVVNNP